jgi:hypothetical protein
MAALHGRYTPSAKDLASRDVVSRDDHGFARAAASDRRRITSPRSSIRDPAAAGISESARFLRRRPDARAIRRSSRPPHYNMGGIDQLSWRGADQKNGNDDVVVPGLMALGEAACVSVQGRSARLQLADRPGDVRPRGRPALRRADAPVRTSPSCRRVRRSAARAARQVP